MNQITATVKASRLVYLSSVALLCFWILGPLYLLAVNALSSPEVINQFPMALIPEFDLESLIFFAKFNGMIDALMNSIAVAVLTMIFSILLGAPAGYALSRFDFVGKEFFRVMILMTRAFPLPLLALPLAVLFIQT